MHSHHHGPAKGRVLNLSLIATALFVVLEAFAGVRGHSLALMSDAGHNATDALALFLAWMGLRMEQRPPDEHKTFGYQRAGVLAALVNASTLVLLSLWIFYEAVMRLRTPEASNTTIMVFTACGGILLNGAIVWGLHGGGNDLNLRSALVHMVGDLVGSAAIVAGALVMRGTGWTWLDPVLSMAIAALIIWTARDIIGESLNILLEGLPRGLSHGIVRDAMRNVDGVLDVHDLHIWSLGSNSRALSCHVLIEDIPPSESTSMLNALRTVLAERFQIRHTTVQFEHLECCPPELLCSQAQELQSHEGHHHGHSHDHADHG